MCGIFGWLDFGNIDLNFKKKIVHLNRRRGNYSFGYLSILKNGVEINKYLIKNLNQNVLDKMCYKDNIFAQFRSPTVKIEEFVYKENYPLELDENFYLFGNAVLNYSFYKRLIKNYSPAEQNIINNDLFYLGKALLEEGFEFLNEIEGVFAISLIKIKGNKLKQLLLIRNIYPLYYNDIIYSSVNPDNTLKELENGVVYDFLKKKTIYKFNVKESPFIF